MMERGTWFGGLRVRVAVTILVGTAWLIFLLLYAAFWSSGFNIFQNIAIVLVSVIAVGGVLAAMWASWGMRFAR